MLKYALHFQLVGMYCQYKLCCRFLFEVATMRC